MLWIFAHNKVNILSDFFILQYIVIDFRTQKGNTSFYHTFSTYNIFVLIFLELFIILFTHTIILSYFFIIQYIFIDFRTQNILSYFFIIQYIFLDFRTQNILSYFFIIQYIVIDFLELFIILFHHTMYFNRFSHTKS